MGDEGGLTAGFNAASRGFKGPQGWLEGTYGEA